jgi:hypothetical protein
MEPRHEERDRGNMLEFMTFFAVDKAYVRKIARDGGWVETKKAPVLMATEALPQTKALGKG